jgi:hypothetical protein
VSGARFRPVDPPRAYRCGVEDAVTMHDVGRMALEPDEQVTFTTPAGGEYDLARKSWGFYATPSLNGRLGRFGLRPVLVRNTRRQWFVLLVERGCEDDFDAYLASERLEVVTWLASDDDLERLERGLAAAEAGP